MSIISCVCKCGYCNSLMSCVCSACMCTQIYVLWVQVKLNILPGSYISSYKLWFHTLFCFSYFGVIFLLVSLLFLLLISKSSVFKCFIVFSPAKDYSFSKIILVYCQHLNFLSLKWKLSIQFLAWFLEL